MTAFRHTDATFQQDIKVAFVPTQYLDTQATAATGINSSNNYKLI